MPLLKRFVFIFTKLEPIPSAKELAREVYPDFWSKEKGRCRRVTIMPGQIKALLRMREINISDR